MTEPSPRRTESSDRLPRVRAWLRTTWPMLLAAAVCGYGWGWWTSQHREAPPPAPPAVSQRAPAPPHVPHLASFGAERPSADARHVANWVVDSGDHEGKSFVVVDKKKARVYLFDRQGRLLAAAPALLGAAVGDDPVPGIGEKPLSQVLPEEKTTPAGRFVAEPGVNAGGEDVVWVSYDLAVSMHRVRPLVKAERRLQRLASPTPKDNRISFGCINLPVAFYEKFLKPTVDRTGAIIYVLPETRTPQEQFGSYEVGDPAQLAGLAPASVK
ncbi:MAG: hypothetical protein ACXWC2_06055 [Ramlibacter sp.]